MIDSSFSLLPLFISYDDLWPAIFFYFCGYKTLDHWTNMETAGAMKI